jgi:hypothetical protein
MSSLYGTDPSYDYSHMYNIKDLRGNLPQPVYNQGTILCTLHEKGCFSKFIDLITKAGLAGIFNDKQAGFTVFAVPDKVIDSSWLKNISMFKAKQYVLYHTLEHSVAPSFLRSSRAMYLNNRIPGSRILLENDKETGTMLNRSVRMLNHPIYAGSSVIYIIDNLLHIDSNPLSNIDI